MLNLITQNAMLSMIKED